MEDRYELQSLVDFSGRYIYHNNHDKTEYNRICSEHMDATIKSYFVKMGTISVSFVICAFGPAYAFYQSKRVNKNNNNI